MLSLRKKYFFSYVLFGITYLLLGYVHLISEWLISITGDYLLSLNIGLIILIVALIFMIVSIVFRFIRSEPVDEMAIQNTRKAQSTIYQVVFLILILIGWNGERLESIGIDFKTIVFTLIGLSQIMEYILFIYYEKKEGLNA